MKVGKGNDFRNSWFTWLIKSSIPFLKRKIPSRFVPWQDNFSQDISQDILTCFVWLADEQFCLPLTKKKKKKHSYFFRTEGWGLDRPYCSVLKGMGSTVKLPGFAPCDLGHLVCLCASVFSSVKWDNYTTVLIGLLRGIKEVTYVQCLKVPGPCKYKNKNC